MTKLYSHLLLMFVSLFAMTAYGAPVAYSINSDSGSAAPTADSLYAIDLANGDEQRKGELFNGIEVRIDTEGLAFSPDSLTLWGIDDESRTLFPIDTTTGIVSFKDQVDLKGFAPLGGNDFGMTFTCAGDLYVTSVLTRTLYRLKLEDGSREIIGSEGALGVNISAIAAIGNPVHMYGLGNGQFEDGSTDSPDLYSIDMQTGVATLIGPLGNQAGEYSQGGLAFDDEGTLWAITDRSIINNKLAYKPSQILRIDTGTGTATLVSETSETGFESLAIVPPRACAVQPEEEVLPRIPTLDRIGRGLLASLLLLAGIAALRKRLC